MRRERAIGGAFFGCKQRSMHTRVRVVCRSILEMRALCCVLCVWVRDFVCQVSSSMESACILYWGHVFKHAAIQSIGMFYSRCLLSYISCREIECGGGAIWLRNETPDTGPSLHVIYDDAFARRDQQSNAKQFYLHAFLACSGRIYCVSCGWHAIEEV